MIPEEAIEKAIAGGWRRFYSWSDIFYRSWGVEDGEYLECDWEEIALDPIFWQSLREALGWSTGKLGYDYPLDEKLLVANWHWMAHRFYDLILTGGDTEAFWREILTPAE